MYKRSISIVDSEVRILGREDFLYQLTIHNASHSYVHKPGVRLHLDVDWYLKQVNVNWPTFLEMVKTFQVATRVYFALLIPKELFDTPVPDEVLITLKPPEWKRKLLAYLINKAGLFNPHEKKFSKAGYILFTVLLYDDLIGLWRGIFPVRSWMQERYGFRYNWLLPYYHLRRLSDLLLKRAVT
ncbi:MAG: nucleotidyltransferase family protein [Chloroflexota bacterium]